MFAQTIRAMVDRWDEAAAAEDDGNKTPGPFAVDASAAFADLSPTADLATLANAVRDAVARPDAFYGPPRANGDRASYAGGWLSFPSAIRTEDAANNTAFARVLESRRRRDAVLLAPHWNASADALLPLAALLNRLGYTTAVVVLPYHHQRKIPSSTVADHFLSANLGRTIRSVRQAVVDLRGAIDWLENRGHRRFYVVGASLGSCIAGLAGAFDPRIRASLLLLTAGSFADVVWTGRATRHIRAALEPAVSRDALRAIWSIISLDTFAERFRNPNHHLLMVSAARDRVVLPAYTDAFLDRLRGAEVAVQQVSLPCGHYSMGMLPFSLCAAARIVSFLRNVSRLGETG